LGDEGDEGDDFQSLGAMRFCAHTSEQRRHRQKRAVGFWLSTLCIRITQSIDVNFSRR
jgi:hypothetical protein